MQIRIEHDPSDETAETLRRGIVEFNRAAVPDLEPIEAKSRFHVIARDNGGKVIGGMRASCYWNTLHIELLWLAAEARGAGVGRRIIRMAEDHAIECGCAIALVETTSWQAKPFYERQEYTLMATLAGRPEGQASHYLSKALTGSAS